MKRLRRWRWTTLARADRPSRRRSTSSSPPTRPATSKARSPTSRSRRRTWTPRSVGRSCRSTPSRLLPNSTGTMPRCRVLYHRLSGTPDVAILGAVAARRPEGERECLEDGDLCRRKESFDVVADDYDRSRRPPPAEVVDTIIEFAHLGPGSAVLEIGCGMGQLSVPLAEHGVDLTAIELGPRPGWGVSEPCGVPERACRAQWIRGLAATRDALRCGGVRQCLPLARPSGAGLEVCRSLPPGRITRDPANAPRERRYNSASSRRRNRAM